MMSVAIAPGTPGFLYVCLAGLVVLVNGLALLAFGLDGRRDARGGVRRVPGGLLLALALAGGAVGAKLGQVSFGATPGRRWLRVGVSAILVGYLVLAGALARPSLPAVAGWVQSTGQSLAASADGGAEIPSFSWRGLLGEREPEHGPDHAHDGLPRRFGPGAQSESPVALF